MSVCNFKKIFLERIFIQSNIGVEGGRWKLHNLTMEVKDDPKLTNKKLEVGHVLKFARVLAVKKI